MNMTGLADALGDDPPAVHRGVCARMNRALVFEVETDDGPVEKAGVEFAGAPLGSSADAQGEGLTWRGADSPPIVDLTRHRERPCPI